MFERLRTPLAVFRPRLHPESLNHVLGLQACLGPQANVSLDFEEWNIRLQQT